MTVSRRVARHACPRIPARNCRPSSGVDMSNTQNPAPETPDVIPTGEAREITLAEWLRAAADAMRTMEAEA